MDGISANDAVVLTGASDRVSPLPFCAIRVACDAFPILDALPELIVGQRSVNDMIGRN